MRIYHDNAVYDLANNAWNMYNLAYRAIASLESIGLEVNDVPANDENSPKLGILYEIQSSAVQQLQTLFGLPGSDALLSLMAECAEKYRQKSIPQELLRWLEEQRYAETEDKNHDVTITIIGSLKLDADSVTNAITVTNQSLFTNPNTASLVDIVDIVDIVVTDAEDIKKS